MQIKKFKKIRNNFMQIKTAKFIKGIVGTDEILRDGKRQIAFVGRSNVGKSSVINSLVGIKKMAKSSATPGRTQEINFFLINDNIYFVDLPGYGFARISKKQREKIRKMIIWYLSYAETKPCKVVLIIDAKVGIKEFDLDMLDLLKEENIATIVVANKIDKVKNKNRNKVIENIKNDLDENVVIVSYSAKTNQNKDRLLNLLTC